MTSLAPMRWKIDGVDRESGVDRTIWIDAASKEEATNMASNHNMMVSDVAQDAVQQSQGGPMQVELVGRQIRTLRVSTLKIAFGVFFGLFLWSVFVFIAMVVFWSVIAVGIAGAAGGM